MYVEFYITTEFLQGTLNELTEDLVVEMRKFNTTTDGRLKLFCVARGENLDEFEMMVESDPTVAVFSHLSGSNGRRLYQIHTRADVDDCVAYRKLTQFDGFLLNARASDSGWYVKTNFPDRDSFRHYRVELADYGIEVEPTIVRNRGYHLPNEPFGISSEQEEILAEAVKTGYFEVPRGVSLAELADNVGISDQAASERLRRAQETLAENAVCNYCTSEY